MKNVYFVLVLVCFFVNTAHAADREYIRKVPTNTKIVIFVHGFTGDYLSTWSEFPNLIVEDNDLNHFDILMWGYPSNKLAPNPKISQVGQHLKTELDLLEKRYRHVVLVAHSMGGLVVRASVVSALADGKREDLEKIKHIVLFGVPNEGLAQANYIPNFINRQVSDMKPTSDFVIELRNEWINRVYRANSQDDNYHFDIPTTTVVGLEDRFVPATSVSSFFPDHATTDGDHTSMVKPTSSDHLSFRLVRQKLLSISSNPLIYDETAFRSVLKEIEFSLAARSEFLFPAIQEFLNRPTKSKWERVQREAIRNLDQLQVGIEKSMDFDSSNFVELRRIVNLARNHTDKKFVNVRRHWNGKEHILIDISRPGDHPPVEQVEEWNRQLRAHFGALKAELERIYQEHAI